MWILPYTKDFRPMGERRMNQNEKDVEKAYKLLDELEDETGVSLDDVKNCVDIIIRMFYEIRKEGIKYQKDKAKVLLKSVKKHYASTGGAGCNCGAKEAIDEYKQGE